MILLADIGGTHVRFALAEAGGIGEPTVLRCRDYPGPEAAARAFLAGRRPPRAAFAVAADVAGDAVDVVNSHWRFSIAAVRIGLGLERLDVVNDFTALALSLPHLAEGDRLQLGGGTACPGAPIGVLGPGTGLGLSGLIPVPGGGWVALAGEGGNATMPAATDREAALLGRLRRDLGHVSAELVLSGPGLVNLYRAVAALSGRPAGLDSPDAVAAHGLDGSCPLCAEALAHFFAMLGTVAGNLALSLGARGGIHLAGGILPRMVEALGRSGFRARFEDFGRFRPYLAGIPTWLILHPSPALIGLSRYTG